MTWEMTPSVAAVALVANWLQTALTVEPETTVPSCMPMVQSCCKGTLPPANANEATKKSAARLRR
jgi:hypothetical protein